MHTDKRRTATSGLGIIVMLISMHTAAQPAAPSNAPVVYTRVARSTSFSNMAVSLYRDGNRELIEMTRAADTAHPHGWHARTWFDFQAHRQYAEDSNAPGKCSVIRYSDDSPPSLLDPVGGAAGMAAQIPAGAPPDRSEMLAGVRTDVYRAGPGATIWVDPAHHLALKAQVTMEGSSTPHTMMDLSGITFDKPDPALLIPPADCTLIAGASNANGGHAEIPARPGN